MRLAPLTVAFPVLLLSALAPGCISLRIGEGDEQPVMRMSGVGSAYADVVGFDDYDGPVLGLDVLSNLGRGEVAAVDIGPIFGVGVGLAGARLRVFPFDIGLGTLFYRPRPPVKTVRDDDEARRRERERGDDRPDRDDPHSDDERPGDHDDRDGDLARRR